MRYYLTLFLLCLTYATHASVDSTSSAESEPSIASSKELSESLTQQTFKDSSYKQFYDAGLRSIKKETRDEESSDQQLLTKGLESEKDSVRTLAARLIVLTALQSDKVSSLSELPNKLTKEYSSWSEDQWHDVIKQALKQLNLLQAYAADRKHNALSKTAVARPAKVAPPALAGKVSAGAGVAPGSSHVKRGDNDFEKYLREQITSVEALYRQFKHEEQVFKSMPPWYNTTNLEKATKRARFICQILCQHITLGNQEKFTSLAEQSNIPLEWDESLQRRYGALPSKPHPLNIFYRGTYFELLAFLRGYPIELSDERRILLYQRVLKQIDNQYCPDYIKDAVNLVSSKSYHEQRSVIADQARWVIVSWEKKVKEAATSDEALYEHFWLAVFRRLMDAFMATHTTSTPDDFRSELAVVRENLGLEAAPGVTIFTCTGDWHGQAKSFLFESVSQGTIVFFDQKGRDQAQRDLIQLLSNQPSVKQSLMAQHWALADYLSQAGVELTRHAIEFFVRGLTKNNTWSYEQWRQLTYLLLTDHISSGEDTQLVGIEQTLLAQLPGFDDQRKEERYAAWLAMCLQTYGEQYWYINTGIKGATAVVGAPLNKVAQCLNDAIDILSDVSSLSHVAKLCLRQQRRVNEIKAEVHKRDHAFKEAHGFLFRVKRQQKMSAGSGAESLSKRLAKALKNQKEIAEEMNILRTQHYHAVLKLQVLERLTVLMRERNYDQCFALAQSYGMPSINFDTSVAQTCDKKRLVRFIKYLKDQLIRAGIDLKHVLWSSEQITKFLVDYGRQPALEVLLLLQLISKACSSSRFVGAVIMENEYASSLWGSMDAIEEYCSELNTRIKYSLDEQEKIENQVIDKYGLPEDIFDDLKSSEVLNEMSKLLPMVPDSFALTNKYLWFSADIQVDFYLQELLTALRPEIVLTDQINGAAA